MVYSGTYALLLALHLLTVVFLVGPAALAATGSPRLVRAGRADALRDAARTTRLYTLATVATVALGSALVGVSGDGTPQWSMGDAWVSASYALWLVAVVLTLVVVVPAQDAAATALDAGQDAAPAGRRITLAACAATACWTAIVVLMVYKPGS
ncbi:MAG: putative integral rane protein [Frankiales bacterium]|nr:putative integral rane protein [Frankiales bacterium]